RRSRPPTSLYTDITYSSLFLFNDTPPTAIYTLSLHDALPIFVHQPCRRRASRTHRRDGTGLHGVVAHPHPRTRHLAAPSVGRHRSEEHTSELQSRFDLVCRLLLEKKKKHKKTTRT